MNCRKYLGTLILIVAAFISQSCSDSSANPQKYFFDSNDNLQPGSSKSVLGYLSLSIGEPTTQTSTGKMSFGSIMGSQTSFAPVPSSQTSFAPVPSMDMLAFWEGEDFEIPAPKVDFGCRVTDWSSFHSSSGNVVPGINRVQYVAGPVGQVVPGTSMTQADLVANMTANNISYYLSPDQKDIQLIPVTEALLNDSNGEPLLSFDSLEMPSLSQPSSKLHGPLYRGKYKNAARIIFGSHQLHINFNKFSAIDLPIDINPFELKNGDSKAEFKLRDLDVRKDVQLEWPSEPGQKGSVMLMISKGNSNNTKGMMTCIFSNTGHATIYAEELDDFAKIAGRTSSIIANVVNVKLMSVQSGPLEMLLYVQLFQTKTWVK